MIVNNKLSTFLMTTEDTAMILFENGHIGLTRFLFPPVVFSQGCAWCFVLFLSDQLAILRFIILPLYSWTFLTHVVWLRSPENAHALCITSEMGSSTHVSMMSEWLARSLNSSEHGYHPDMTPPAEKTSPTLPLELFMPE